MSATKVRIVCVSDTHNKRPGEGFTLPKAKGDILIHAGDLTNQGSLEELKKAVDWISKAEFSAKIVIAGNHDLSLDPGYTLKHKNGWSVQPADVEACRQLLVANPGITYLQHAETVIHLPQKGVSLRVFGSPYSPDRGKQNWAFQYPVEDASSIWDGIPSGIDVLVTHTPAAGLLDTSKHWIEGGCSTLGTALARVKPMLHICGHCHEGRGALVVDWEAFKVGASAMTVWQDPGAGNKKQSLLDLTRESPEMMPLVPGRTAVINSSIMSKSHSINGSPPCNKPIVVDVNVPSDSTFSDEAA